MRVTVFRQVPSLIIGTCGVVPHHDFDAFEERLDSLEAGGATVERFEPANAADTIAKIPAVRRLVASEGERCFPLVLVNDEIVASGKYPSRTEWAHAIGESRRTEELSSTR
jgi:arsenical resistance operon trans-acting repressor ArsD